jgi:alkanesulfonate monooxygenase SsuD/methylene tetrahydromethanopterin reductase-like flavin-dependent oxidoreductase (luciferase family)
VQVPRLGLRLPDPRVDSSPPGAFEQMAAVAQAAEGTGFDSVWVHDGPAPDGDGHPDPGALFAPYTLLGALAARTTTAALVVYPVGRTVRAPSMVAKLVSAIDVISHGRAVLSLGAGTDTDTSSDERLAEELQICRALLTEETPSFIGRYHRIVEAPNLPRPPAGHRVPLVVATDRADLLGTVARYADALVVTGSPDRVEAAVQALGVRCDAVGRPRREVAVLWGGTLAVAPSAEAASRACDRLASLGEALAPVGAGTVVGDVGRVADALAALAGAGAAGFVVRLADSHVPDTMALAGAVLTGAVGG